MFFFSSLSSSSRRQILNRITARRHLSSISSSSSSATTTTTTTSLTTETRTFEYFPHQKRRFDFVRSSSFHQPQHPNSCLRRQYSSDLPSSFQEITMPALSPTMTKGGVTTWLFLRGKKFPPGTFSRRSKRTKQPWRGWNRWRTDRGENFNRSREGRYRRRDDFVSHGGG